MRGAAKKQATAGRPYNQGVRAAVFRVGAGPWSPAPPGVLASSERRPAPPAARLAAAGRVLAAGYKVGFHLDPVIAYPGAERDYLALLLQANGLARLILLLDGLDESPSPA